MTTPARKFIVSSMWDVKHVIRVLVKATGRRDRRLAALTLLSDLDVAAEERSSCIRDIADAHALVEEANRLMDGLTGLLK